MSIYPSPVAIFCQHGYCILVDLPKVAEEYCDALDIWRGMRVL
jgi:hypothetical protein